MEQTITNMTFEEIGQLEGCNKSRIKKSVDSGIKKLEKFLK